MDRLGLPTQELARQVEVTRNYFRSKGEDPAIYAPDFLWFHVTHGRTPQEIYAIALNKPLTCVHGKTVCGICAEARQ